MTNTVVLFYCVISISAFNSSNRYSFVGWHSKCFFRHYSMCLCKMYQINIRSLSISNPVLICTYRVVYMYIYFRYNFVTVP